MEEQKNEMEVIDVSKVLAEEPQPEEEISEEIPQEAQAPAVEAETTAPAEAEKKKEKGNALYSFYTLLHDLVYILMAIVIIFVFFVRLVRVNGESMTPNLQDQDYLALQSNVIMSELEPGDVIVARKQSFNEGEPIVKRVIATEGQVVDIDYSIGAVYVDGERLDEPYIKEVMREPGYPQVSFPQKVEPGCIFVMGDNRNGSADSRYISIGQIETDQVLGKVLMILVPGDKNLSRIGAVSDGR